MRKYIKQNSAIYGTCSTMLRQHIYNNKSVTFKSTKQQNDHLDHHATRHALVSGQPRRVQCDWSGGPPSLHHCPAEGGPGHHPKGRSMGGLRNCPKEGGPDHPMWGDHRGALQNRGTGGMWQWMWAAPGQGGCGRGAGP